MTLKLQKLKLYKKVNFIENIIISTTYSSNTFVPTDVHTNIHAYIRIHMNIVHDSPVAVMLVVITCIVILSAPG